MSEALLLSIIERLDDQQRKIDELHQKIELISKGSDTSRVIMTKLDAIENDLQNNCSPIGEVRELLSNFLAGIDLLKQPVKKEIVHHHHATKTLWVPAALFLIVCLLSTGWYLTSSAVQVYKANDTKYRYLKLQAGTGVAKAVDFIDSLYLEDGSLRDEVIKKEEEQRRKFDMLRKAYEMERAAKDMKRQVENGSSTKESRELVIPDEIKKIGNKRNTNGK